MASAATYRRELSVLARRYGFGFVDRKRSVRGALHAARYLAKYLSEGTDKLGIGDLAARGDCPAVIVRVNRELSRQTGMTIRSRRQARGIFCLARDLGCSLEQARDVRLQTTRTGHRRWNSRTTSGRASLPWDVQTHLAEWDRTAAAAADSFRQWQPPTPPQPTQLDLF
jgi:hypothetical protein